MGCALPILFAHHCTRAPSWRHICTLLCFAVLDRIRFPICVSLWKTFANADIFWLLCFLCNFFMGILHTFGFLVCFALDLLRCVGAAAVCFSDVRMVIANCNIFGPFDPRIFDRIIPFWSSIHSHCHVKWFLLHKWNRLQKAWAQPLEERNISGFLTIFADKGC